MARGAWKGWVAAAAETARATNRGNATGRLRLNRMESKTWKRDCAPVRPNQPRRVRRQAKKSCECTFEASLASEWESNWTAVSYQLSATDEQINPSSASLTFFCDRSVRRA